MVPSLIGENRSQWAIHEHIGAKVGHKLAKVTEARDKVHGMQEVNPELSSIQTALEEIAQRVKNITDQIAADPNDTRSVALIGMERSLASAIRQIAKAQKSR